MKGTKEQVKKANREFYDIVGYRYEEIDGRRSDELLLYTMDQLGRLSKESGSEAILDLGCGSGFITKSARPYFKKRYALDISSEILKTIEDIDVVKINSDMDTIPIKDNELNCVAAFAVLHHCYSYEKMIPEIARILKPGGAFYSDHDMDSFFFHRYRILLRLYRKIRNASQSYRSQFSQLTEEMYHCTEFHEEGIQTEHVEELLKACFSKVDVQYHWFGLTPLSDKVFGKRSYKKGYAPLVKIIAVK